MIFSRPDLLWLLLVVPLVACYHLLLRESRREIVVPDLGMWEGTRHFPRRVRWEKALLITPCAMLSIPLILALAGPVVPFGEFRFAAVLDNSASMAALDPEPRWQEACKIARDCQARGSGVFILTDPEPRMVSPQEIAKSQPENAGDPEKTVEFARGLLEPGENLLVITDGAGEAWRRVLSGLEAASHPLAVHIVGSASANRSIRLAAARRREDGKIHADLEILRHGAEPGNAEVRWTYPGAAEPKIFEARFDSKGASRKSLEFPWTQAGLFETWLPDDALPSDNRMDLILPRPSKAKVLLLTDRPRPYLAAALASCSEWVDVAGSAVAEASPGNPEGYDLAIVCGMSWSAAPKARKLLLFATDISDFASRGSPSALCWGAGEHPVARNLDLLGFRIHKAEGFRPPENARILAHGDRGPIIWEGGCEGQELIYVDFSPEDSELPFRAAFPVFVHNVVSWALPSAAWESPSHAAESEIAPNLAARRDSTREIVGHEDGRAPFLKAAMACVILWGFLKFLSLLCRLRQVY